VWKIFKYFIITLIIIAPPILGVLFLLLWWKGDLPDKKKRVLHFKGWSFLFPLALSLPFIVLWFMAIAELTEDYLTWFQLMDKGETITVPLRAVHKFEGSGKLGDSFEAVYEYNGSVRHEDISRDQYRDLKGKPTISLWVYGDTSRVTGWHPFHFVVPFVLWFATLSVWVMSMAVWDAYNQLETEAYKTRTAPKGKSAPTRFGIAKRRAILAYARWRNWKTPPPPIKLPPSNKPRHRHKQQTTEPIEKPKRDKVKRKPKNT
jgi:hypothetical protein